MILFQVDKSCHNDNISCKTTEYADEQEIRLGLSRSFIPTPRKMKKKLC